MRIVFTGGGSGGHFYPIIAVVEAVHEIVREEKLLEPELYFIAPDPYDKRALFEHDIYFESVPAGKRRLYASPKNISDMFKTAWGILKAIRILFSIYPDVVFAKGGYTSFPTLVAARILNIPVVIHESDSVPGRVNKWAGAFAERIAVSYPQSIEAFPKDKTALTGNPIRKDLLQPTREGAFEYLHLETDVPVVFILGGSQGAERINTVILDALPKLLNEVQIIHQTGPDKLDEVKETASVILEEHAHRDRYKPFGFLNDLAMRMAAGAADLVISRAGSTIFEIAVWGIPSIIIPIPEEISRDQRSNAFAYSRTGAARVVEEENLADDILIAQIREILTDDELYERMSTATEQFAKTDAAEKIARQLINIGLQHEQ